MIWLRTIYEITVSIKKRNEGYPINFTFIKIRCTVLLYSRTKLFTIIKKVNFLKMKYKLF